MNDLAKIIGPVAPMTACKVCGEDADLYGVADFNKSCEELRQKYLRLSGVPVYYHRCSTCGFIFTRAFDHWTSSDFKKHVYNDDYILVDPEYAEVRPVSNAGFIAGLIGNARALKCLDYGGGNGDTARLLRARGIDASSWDPFGTDQPLPAGQAFDLISAFEVFEHTTDPAHTAKESLGLLNQQGVLVFSTVMMDSVPPRGMDHWYIAPRNGHISLYTQRALQTLFAPHGYDVLHFSAGVHIAVRDTPSWLKTA